MNNNDEKKQKAMNVKKKKKKEKGGSINFIGKLKCVQINKNLLNRGRVYCNCLLLEKI